jgi:hypothetical protein
VEANYAIMRIARFFSRLAPMNLKEQEQEQKQGREGPKDWLLLLLLLLSLLSGFMGIPAGEFASLTFRNRGRPSCHFFDPSPNI